MDKKHAIARRTAQCFRDGDLVNLGVGTPELTSLYTSPGVIFQAESGFIGMGPYADGPESSEHYFNAASDRCHPTFGASTCDLATSFGIMRSGRLDATVLGAFQVSEHGDLANWATPDRFFGIGGAMDLVSGAKKVIVATEHCTKDGAPKILRECTLPYTGRRCVDLIITELCVLEVTPKGLLLTEIAPGVTVEELQAKTDAPFRIADNLKTIEI